MYIKEKETITENTEQEKIKQISDEMFFRAFSKANDQISEHNSNSENLNLSGIATKLIQETGRFCEYYASDFIILWNSLAEYVESLDKTNIEQRQIFVFGIRRDGVDGNSFTASRLTGGFTKNHFNLTTRNEQYRKIYAVVVERTLTENEWRTNVTLRDIQFDIRKPEYENEKTQE